MRPLLFALALLAASSSLADAQQSRRGAGAGAAPSCADLQGRIGATGRAVLPTGPGTFEEIIGEGALCSGNEARIPAIVSARDTPQCRIGYRCERVSSGGSR